MNPMAEDPDSIPEIVHIDPMLDRVHDRHLGRVVILAFNRAPRSSLKFLLVREFHDG